MNDFGKKLKYLLKKRNITQMKLADEIGVSRSSITHYINGKVEPRTITVKAICDFFGVPISYFEESTDINDYIELEDRTDLNENTVYEIVKKLILETKNGLEWKTLNGDIQEEQIIYINAIDIDDEYKMYETELNEVNYILVDFYLKDIVAIFSYLPNTKKFDTPMLLVDSTFLKFDLRRLANMIAEKKGIEKFNELRSKLIEEIFSRNKKD